MFGMRILIADDNASMRTILEKVIARVGKFDIDFARTGNEALQLYRQHHHHLMIIDNFMPDINGIDVLRELRTDPMLSNTHVIMVTSEPSKQLVTAIRAELLKIDDLIAKPIDFEKLMSKVTAVSVRYNRNIRKDGPLLKQGEQKIPIVNEEITLTADVVDRGNIAIIELKGRLINSNRSVISQVLKDVQTIFALTVVIDINGIEEMDEFGCGTLAVMSGWLVLNDKETFLACDDCATKGRITALGINNLVPRYTGCLDII